MFAKNIDGKQGIFQRPCIFVLLDASTGRFHFGFGISDFGFAMFTLSGLYCRFLVTASVIFLVCAFASCVREIDRPETRSTHTVTDDLGRQVELPQHVARAISLAPSITESIFAAGAGDRLVGVTTYCNYPAETASIEKVGDTLNPNIERIIALKPDIVFISTASQLEAFTETLAEQKVAVYVSSASSLDSVIEGIRKLGEIFETDGPARKTADDMERRTVAMGDYLDDRPPSRVFVQISKEPLFTIGKSAFLTEAVQFAGGESVTKNVESAYPKLSKETALALNPDVIILSDSEDNQEPNVVFKNSPAVKNGRVYKINADIISRPGPRLVDAIEQIAGFLHGEKN
jgi:iron complex transport system substrate-binding protein